MQIIRKLKIAVLVTFLLAGCASAVDGNEELNSSTDSGCSQYSGVSKQNKYYSGGLETGLACFDQGLLQKADLDALIDNRKHFFSAGDQYALQDLELHADTYVLNEPANYQRLIGQELLSHAITVGIDAGGRYGFLLGVSLIQSDCAKNSVSAIDALTNSANKGHILAMALLASAYSESAFCIDENKQLFAKYKKAFDSATLQSGLSYENAVLYLGNLGILPKP